MVIAAALFHVLQWVWPWNGTSLPSPLILFIHHSFIQQGTRKEKKTREEEEEEERERERERERRI